MYVMYGIWSNFVESSPKLAVRKGVTTFHSHEFFSQKQYLFFFVLHCKITYLWTYLLLENVKQVVSKKLNFKVWRERNIKKSIVEISLFIRFLD